MPRIRVVWKRRAQQDLREIKKYIARDAPRTAASYVRKLKAAVEQLKQFPELGSVVEDLDNPAIRELILGNYRIIYRYRSRTIEILMVFHSARLLGKDELEKD